MILKLGAIDAVLAAAEAQAGRTALLATRLRQGVGLTSEELQIAADIVQASQRRARGRPRIPVSRMREDAMVVAVLLDKKRFGKMQAAIKHVATLFKVKESWLRALVEAVARQVPRQAALDREVRARFTRIREAELALETWDEAAEKSIFVESDSLDTREDVHNLEHLTKQLRCIS